ncbi:hypothetical protein [Micromonospora sp. CA-111912]|uniref:hypothetical protein n=1 Tax=Micromonospora sp. CA-111912 TaxID=3239955 RepID=UPI003D934F3B
MKAPKVAATLFFAFVTLLAAPTAASAQEATSAPVAAVDDISVNSSICGTGRVESIATNLPIRSTPNTTGGLITTAQKGYQYDCDITVTGGWVTACGVYSNLWVRINFSSQDGFTYAACLDDV